MTTIELFKNLAKGIPDLNIKGVSMPYVSVNGNMFAFITKDGLLHLRLNDELRNEIIQNHYTQQTLQHGILMKDYISIPESLMSDKKILKSYFKHSYNYVSSLKLKSSAGKIKLNPMKEDH